MLKQNSGMLAAKNLECKWLRCEWEQAVKDDARCREQRKEGYREGRAAKTGGRERGEAMESLSVSRDAASARRGVRRDGESEEAGSHASRNSD